MSAPRALFGSRSRLVGWLWGMVQRWGYCWGICGRGFVCWVWSQWCTRIRPWSFAPQGHVSFCSWRSHAPSRARSWWASSGWMFLRFPSLSILASASHRVVAGSWDIGCFSFPAGLAVLGFGSGLRRRCLGRVAVKPVTAERAVAVLCGWGFNG